MKKALIVLPTYNESGTIEQLIKEIFSLQKTVSNWLLEILVVDSCSPDNTDKIINKLQEKYKNLYFLSAPKEGLGKAYVRGFKFALEKIQPYIFFEMDADLQHNPKVLVSMLKKIEEGADFVIASRYIKGGSIPKNWGLDRKLYSVLGNLFVRLGFMNLKIHDWTSGYRAIKAWIIKNNLTEISKYSGYIFQIAVLNQAIKNNAKIAEVPQHFGDRTQGVSKINSKEFILNIFGYLLRNSSFIKFVIVGLLGFVIDFSISKVEIENLKMAVWLSTFISAFIAMSAGFLMNNYWSFSHKKIKRLGQFLIKYFQYAFVSSGNILIQSLGMELTTRIFGITYWYLYKILILGFVIIPYSYFMYNKFVWKK